MGDAFVAGQTEAALNVARGHDGAFRNRKVQGDRAPAIRIIQTAGQSDAGGTGEGAGCGQRFSFVRQALPSLRDAEET